MNATIPALQPPAGTQSNFENPQSRAYLTVVPCAAIVGLMIIFVFTRMYTKVYVLKSVGWDDLYGLGYGVHQWDITYDHLISLLFKEVKCLAALWGPAMFFTKLSLLLLYHRVFAPDRVTTCLVYFGVFYCFVLYTSALLLTFLLCPSMLTASCKYQANLFIFISSGLNVAGDIYFLIIPLAAVAKLHLPTRKKFGASAIFFAGLLACASGILALYYRIKLLYTQDLTWHSTPIAIFTVMEINTGIIVSCMPTMPALIQDVHSEVTRSRKPSQKFRCQSQRSRDRHHSSRTSNSRTLQKKKLSSQITKGPVRFELPDWGSPDRGSPDRESPVELEANPVRMEEAYMGSRVEPRSFFSDDSSDFESEDWGAHGRDSYAWLS
ncbi:MAG: hypothetical protein Q9181_002028 [Wetmoreana brouardii]